MGVDDDPVLEALDDLEEALKANAVRTDVILDRIARVRELRANGVEYADLATREAGPSIVQLITASATALDHYGVRLRRTAAQVLYNEGLTMEQIAEVFGVTRQRISALLKISDQ
jgi:hypothetical protein